MPINLRRTNPVSLNAAFGMRMAWRRAIGLGAGAAGVLALAGWALPQTDAPVQSLLLSTIGSGPSKPAFKADCSASPASLQTELSALAGSFDGKVGIAVAKAGCDWTVGARLDQWFPQQSVSKLWVSLSVLDQVDRGAMRLEDALAIGPQDLTLFHQPIRAEVIEQGVAVKPVHDLMRVALAFSDNTANDRLLWALGGPKRVRQTLAAKQIEGIRFGPGERLLQSEVAGLAWDQSLALGRNFEQARARLPLDQREAALARYIEDPIDGATPAGMAQALARLAAGDLLSPQATGAMLDILAKTHSGPRRLKAGAPPGWQVFHKTGTGQELRGQVAGYNDVALLKAPDGAIYAVAVMIGATRRPVPERMDLMQAVSRAVGQYHLNTMQSKPGSDAA